jgi:hypothetical protein
VDLRAQSSDEREGKRQGEVVGVRCLSGHPREERMLGESALCTGGAEGVACHTQF